MTDEATPTPEPTPETPSAKVTLPVGQEFQVTTHHEYIAQKLGVKLEQVFFEIKTDIENGVHHLIGYFRGT